MKRVVVLVGLMAVGVVAIVATQSSATQNVAEIEQVKDNLYVIKGGGGNTAAFITDGGVVVVDTKLAGWGQAILDKIRGVTDKPVTTIINTHTHGDHVGSNAEFPAEVEVIVHENTKANMEKMDAFKAAGAAHGLPDRSYSDKLSLMNGADAIDLYHVGRGHTNGDTIVVFPALRVAHTGDLFPYLGVPFMDASNGGSGLAYPDTIKKAISTVPNVDTIIPGHSDVTNWQGLLDFGEYIEAFVNAVRKAKSDGRTAEQAAANLGLPEEYADYNTGRLEASVKTIYAELDQ